MNLCIVGPSCAGKTTAAEYLSRDDEFEYIEASDFVRDRWEKAPNDQDIMNFVKDEFESNGMETFAEDAVSDLQALSSDNKIICGYRAFEEVEYTRNKVDESLVVIGIFTNSLLRYQRKLKRDNPSSEYTYLDFITKDFQEYEFGILELLHEGLDHIVINEGPMNEFFRNIEDIVDN